LEHFAFLIRNCQYGDSIENISEKRNDDKTSAFPLLVQAIATVTSKYLALAIIRKLGTYVFRTTQA